MINKVKENSSSGGAAPQPNQDSNQTVAQPNQQSQAGQQPTQDSQPADANSQQQQAPAQNGQPAPAEQVQDPNQAVAQPNQQSQNGQQPPQDSQPADANSQQQQAPAQDGQPAPAEQVQDPNQAVAQPNQQSQAGQQPPQDSQSADANSQQQQAPAEQVQDPNQAVAQPNQQSQAGQQPTQDSQPADANSQQQQAPAQNGQPAQQASPEQGKAQEANKDLEKLDQQQEETSNTFASKNISRESASMLNLLMEQIKTLVEVSNNLNERTREVEKRLNEITVDSEKSKEESKIINEKMDMMEKNMEKFIGLYEVVTNQYNPFLESSTEPQGNSNSTVEEEEEIDSDDVEVQQAPQSNTGALPTATEIMPNQQNQTGQEYSGGASFNFEDRITGESGFVGNPNQQNQQYGQQGFQSNFQPNQNYGTQAQNGQQYNQHQSQQFSQQNNNFNPQQSNPQQNNPQQFNPNQNQQYSQNQPSNQFNPQQAPNNFQPANTGYTSPNQQGQNPMMMPTQKKIATLQDMLEELAVMDDNSFYNLVNGQRNEIANWVMNSLGNLELGTELLRCRTRVETIKSLSRYIHNGPQAPPQPSGFRFSNGKIANDIEEMMDELIYIDDSTFAGHVNNQKNDIADWIQSSLNIQDLANRARGLTKKTDLIRELALYLHSRN